MGVFRRCQIADAMPLAGIPTTFNFRRDGDLGWKELDFIIASRQDGAATFQNFISVPIYMFTGQNTPHRKPTVCGASREVEPVLGEGAYFVGQSQNPCSTVANFQENWAVSWDGFDPASKFHTYAVEWLPGAISWYVGAGDAAATRKITLKKNPVMMYDFFPKGPLP